MLNTGNPRLNGMSPGQEMCTSSGTDLCAHQDPLCLWEALSHVTDLPRKSLVSLREGRRQKTHKPSLMLAVRELRLETENKPKTFAVNLICYFEVVC